MKDSTDVHDDNNRSHDFGITFSTPVRTSSNYCDNEFNKIEGNFFRLMSACIYGGEKSSSICVKWQNIQTKKCVCVYLCLCV
jgi:hypothetical protein